MKLRKIIIFIVAMIAAAPALFSATVDNNNRFTIAISTTQDKFKTGDEIRVHVVLTNVSEQTYRVFRSVSSVEAEVRYTVSVQDPNGKDVQMTKHGREALAGTLVGSLCTRVLKPGEKLELDAILSKLYDLSTPGLYDVQFSRHISDDPGNDVVMSNKLKITVTQ